MRISGGDFDGDFYSAYTVLGHLSRHLIYIPCCFPSTSSTSFDETTSVKRMNSSFDLRKDQNKVNFTHSQNSTKIFIPSKFVWNVCHC